MLTVYEFTSGIRALKGNVKTKDVLDTGKRLEYSYNFMNEVLDRKLRTLDKVMLLSQHDLEEMRSDVDLITRATRSLTLLVREYMTKARQLKKEMEEDRVADVVDAVENIQAIGTDSVLLGTDGGH